MQDFLYVSLSFVFVFFVLGLSTLFSQLKWLNEEGSRKFVHIGVSNWILFLLLFEQVLFAVIAPVAFILLNYLSYRKNIFKAMERVGKGNLGTVYFPIALLLVVLFTFFVGENKVFAPAAIAGILVLGYGDGLAAIIGKHFGKTRLINGKSLEGSLTMFVVSLIVLFMVTLLGQPSLMNTSIVLIPFIALLITLTELITPYGLDNLSIPVVTTLLFFLMMQV